MKKAVITAVMLFFVLSAWVYAQGNATVSAASGVPADNDTLAAPQGVCASAGNIITSGLGRIKVGAVYALSRDYGSAARNGYYMFKGWSVTAKIFLVLAILIILFLLWNYFIRDTRANNLRRARAHHEKGEKAHQEGDEEKAQKQYEKARKYREKAQEQW